MQVWHMWITGFLNHRDKNTKMRVFKCILSAVIMAAAYLTQFIDASLPARRTVSNTHQEGLAEEDTINYVSGDEVVIDQLEDFLQSRRHLDDQPSPPYLPQQARTSPPYLPQQGVNGKIHFAVSPKDQRYYLPVSSLRPVEPPEQVEEEEEGLRLLPQDLGLQPQQVYPGEFFQYQDEEQQDPSQYQPQYRYEPRRPQEQDQYQPQFLPRLPYSRYPEEAVYDVRRLDPRLMGAEGEREEMEENTGREEIKRLMVDENDDYNVDKNTKTAEEAETTVAPQKVATSQPEAVNYMHLRHSPSEAKESSYAIHDANQQQQPHLSDLYFTAVVAGCTAVAVCGVIGAGICWYRLNKSHKAAQDAEYPAYGVTGPNKDLSPSSGDRKLAQSAHMYHYQHQKQQMIALEKSSGGERHGSTSDVDSEEEGEENEYTVYECPGLAPTGEMEVKNPLFHDDPTPATPSMRKEAEKEEEEEEEEQKAK